MMPACDNDDDGHDNAHLYQDDDDNNISDDDSGDDDDDNDNDDDDDDDNDDDALPQTEVEIHDSLDGNPLARKITVTTDIPCSLSGYVTTMTETGYGPSYPVKSPDGTVHEFWFYGLLTIRTFEYAFHVADNPDKVVATGEFVTPALPESSPGPIEITYIDDDTTKDWYMMYYHFFPDGNRTSFNFIFDRKGRFRFYHQLSMGNFSQVMSNGHIVSTKESELVAVRLDGTEYAIFDVNLNQPVLKETHHKFYLEDHDAQTATVLFGREGPGVECDGVTPTSQMVGDGIAEIDKNGNELWRWDVFDYMDQIPVTAIHQELCELNYYGPNKTDWTHGNAVIPVPGENAYIISHRNVSRIIKIDRGTGDIIWQMGDGLDFEWLGDEPVPEKWFHLQHDPHILPNGNMIVYDNSFYPSAPWSRVLELDVDETNMTVSMVWEYRVPHHGFQGNAQVHDSGNILIGTGTKSTFTELPSNGISGDELMFMDMDKGNVRVEYYPPLWVDSPYPSK